MPLPNPFRISWFLLLFFFFFFSPCLLRKRPTAKSSFASTSCYKPPFHVFTVMPVGLSLTGKRDNAHTHPMSLLMLFHSPEAHSLFSLFSETHLPRPASHSTFSKVFFLMSPHEMISLNPNRILFVPLLELSYYELVIMFSAYALAT